MAGCPNEPCKNSHEELRDFVYGKEPGKGKGLQGWIARVETCTLKLVPKAWLWKAAVAFGVVLIMGIAVFYGGVRSNQSASARNTRDISKHEVEIEELEDISKKNSIHLEHIKDSLGDIKTAIKEILKEQRRANDTDG